MIIQYLYQQNVDSNDFSIQLEDGTNLQFRLDTEATIGDVVNLINAAPSGGSLTARLATNGNGIELVSTATGASAFQVRVENNSGAAVDLGLVDRKSTRLNSSHLGIS